jgi:hypothetical protein
MSNVTELYGVSTKRDDIDWQAIVNQETCPFLGRRCVKRRKSVDLTIGTCSVAQSKSNSKPIMICPHRLLERRKVFLDCLHLLTQHEPGNDLHVVPETKVPGGNVDYFLVSMKSGKIIDFVGIEFQTLDTTGTLWSDRQRFLLEKGMSIANMQEAERGTYGINWKMTAKTILIQIHHKIKTFEHLNRHLVLVIQQGLMDNLIKNFDFGHLGNGSIGDSMHFHSYEMMEQDNSYSLVLQERRSTDADGIAIGLGQKAEAKIELEVILKSLSAKISPQTLLTV